MCFGSAYSPLLPQDPESCGDIGLLVHSVLSPESMAIYSKKTSERIITSTIRIDPDCYIGSKVVRFRASVEKPRVFYLMELIEDDPGEITQVVERILHPEQTIRPLTEIEKEAILTALRIFDGDKLATATALGIGKTTLYRKLAEYDETPNHRLYQEIQH